MESKLKLPVDQQTFPWEMPADGWLVRAQLWSIWQAAL